MDVVVDEEEEERLVVPLAGALEVGPPPGQDVAGNGAGSEGAAPFSVLGRASLGGVGGEGFQVGGDGSGGLAQEAQGGVDCLGTAVDRTDAEEVAARGQGGQRGAAAGEVAEEVRPLGVQGVALLGDEPRTRREGGEPGEEVAGGVGEAGSGGRVGLDTVADDDLSVVGDRP